MATLWEIAAHSVDHMFPLYFDYAFVILVISRFSFEGWIWVLVSSVPDLCILLAYNFCTNHLFPHLFLQYTLCKRLLYGIACN